MKQLSFNKRGNAACNRVLKDTRVGKRDTRVCKCELFFLSSEGIAQCDWCGERYVTELEEPSPNEGKA